MKKAGLWLCNLFVKVLDKQVCNIRLYEVVLKITVICFVNNIKCSLNVNKRIPVDEIEQCGIEAKDIHGYFCVLTICQRTPGFWGVIVLLQRTETMFKLITVPTMLRHRTHLIKPLQKKKKIENRIRS